MTTDSGESLTDQVTDATKDAVDSVTNWWESDLAQEWLVNKPVLILVTLIVAFIAHWALRRIIDRLAHNNIVKNSGLSRFRRSHSKDDDPLAQTRENRRQSRVRTLASVSKSAVAIFVWVMAGLSILSTVGVNIAPLIASAGVAGVALGFGAQSLVKDFLSGIFMLVEDQYGVGDTIDVGDDISGDVEDISLRITTIRDIDGTLWYVRNGEILRVGNFSDKYAISRIQVPVGLSNNPEDAWNVIQKSVEDGIKDPDIAAVILEDPQYNGISTFEVDHISYRISIKVLPGQQWMVQRKLSAKILTDMQAAGISTPYPHGIGINPPA